MTVLAVILVGSPWAPLWHLRRYLVQVQETFSIRDGLQFGCGIVGCASAAIRARWVAFEEVAQGFFSVCERHSTFDADL
ncbi:MAG: hypothetical protein OXP73_05985 [Chloroflexota bacterium]|nr:hypothetical protein [Chloroflexota bacterium]